MALSETSMGLLEPLSIQRVECVRLLLDQVGPAQWHS